MPDRARAPQAHSRPSVLVTRRIPSAVLARLEARCEVDLYAGPSGLSPAELQDRVRGKRALLCLMSDQVDRAVIDAGSEPGRRRGRSVG